MSNSRKQTFCQQLSNWLYATEWHFTTLLAICIDSVRELPDDADNFVNCLLLTFPEKPTYEKLSNYINDSTIIENWFDYNLVKPSIRSFNLATADSTLSVDSNFPQFNSLSDLAYWFGVSLTQLEWLADIKRIDIYEPDKYQHYYYSLVEKRRRGARLIESPKTLLKRVQRQIYSGLLTRTSVHSAAHGFRQNRSCLSHAGNHTNQEYLFTFDLANHFHSIDWYRIYRIF